MYILGISAYYHDSAACLLKDGEIIAAAQEERFTRKKHDANFPRQAIKYCLKEANIIASQIDNIVFYEKPFVKFERLLETYLAFAPKGFISFAKAMPVWIKNKLFQKSALIKEFKATLDENINWQKRLLFSEHHLSHAASAFYPSPYERAAVLTIDGVGEWTTTSLAIGKGRDLKVIKEIHFPHSLGLLYSAFTYYTGFKVNSGEYKMMGLAPYGQPRYTNLIHKKLIKIAKDGSFQLDMSYFNYATGLTMTNKKFDTLFGGPPRRSETKITQRDMDLAASVQKVTEDILIQIAKGIARDTGEKNLCLAGGVALNCVANGILLREKIFNNIWVQPAAGDAGGALGAALSAWYLHHNKERVISSERDEMKGSYLGPEYSDIEIEAELKTCRAVYQKLTKDKLIDEVVAALVDEKAIGWMQGRMEFGPRALGGRSIIADPRSGIMQKQLNLKVKFRESFRPFAPSILREDIKEWFEHDTDSPYMLLVADIQKNKRRSMTAKEVSLFGIDKLNIPRSSVPAITHVDYSARIQTVHADTNPRYHLMISKFKEKTGCPLVVNTSFNVRGEPIVCSPTDAFKCFMGTELDVLAVGNYILFKEEQDETLKENY
ncbi:carbamoyltransferase, partial [Candidatus Pelagibacter ubique]|nr:carbamoyltransferase [Candidatus Pelagibacter ubique]